MTLARYWKLSAIEVYSTGANLELSEIALYESGSRVDATATITSTVAPLTGSLANLSDANTSTTVSWLEVDARKSGFAIMYDFGVAKDITKIGIAGPTQASFAHKFDVFYSTDNAAWSRFSALAPATKWTDANTFFECDTANGDPFVSNVVLALHGAGATGSLQIVDTSPAGKVLLQNNNQVIIDSVQSKFGGSAIHFASGTTDQTARLSIAAGLSDFNFDADFTVELWLYAYAYSSTWGSYLFATSNTTNTSGTGWVMYYGYPGTANKIGFSVLGIEIQSNAAPSLNAWHHIAVTRASGVLRMFVDGVLQTATATVAGVTGVTTFLMACSQNVATTTGIHGHLDDVRITKGVARYTASFTAPTRAFPDALAGPVLDTFDTTPTREISSATPAGVGYDCGSATMKFDNYGFTKDVEDFGYYQVVGTVKEKALPTNLPLSRRVRLHREIDSRMLREVWSDPVTGAYSFDHIRSDKYYVVAFDHTLTYRAVIADNLTPDLMP